MCDRVHTTVQTQNQTTHTEGQSDSSAVKAIAASVSAGGGVALGVGFEVKKAHTRSSLAPSLPTS